MKYSVAITAAAASLVAAQGSNPLAALPQCGQTCVGNMLQIAQSQFGCAVGNVTCYCTNVDFGYGVRDCSNQACPSADDAAKVIAYGTAYCQQALGGASGNGAGPVLSSAATATPTDAGALSSAGASAASAGATGAGATGGAAGASGANATAVTTVPLLATITTDGSTITTTTGFSTVFSNATGAAGNGTSSAGGAASTAASGASGAASTATGAVGGAAGTVTSGVGGAASSASSGVAGAASSAVGSSSSSAGAAIITAAPMIGAAALAALFL